MEFSKLKRLFFEEEQPFYFFSFALQVEFVVCQEPSFGYSSFHGFLIIVEGARHKEMTEVFFLHFARAGDLHPPSFAFFAFEKDDGHVVGHENAELVVVLGVFVWKVVLSPVVSFDEVPEGVRYDLGSAAVVVFFFVVVVNSYRGKFVAHACEVEYLAKLLAIETVRIVAARGV